MNARSFGLGGMRRLPTTFLVARREVRMRLRSRVFVGGTIVMAVLVVVGIVAASLLAGKTTPVRVGFSGGSQALEPAFTATAAALGVPVTVTDISDVTAGKAQVTAGTLDVLVIGTSTAPTAVAKDGVPSNVESALSLAAEAARLSDAGLSPTAVKSAMALVPVQLLVPPNPKDNENLFASLALGIILWIALGQYGNMVAQGVVEEKATRIMEILLATIQPSRLLTGKVIGIGLVGLLQLTIVGTAALVAVHVTNVAPIPALGLVSILGDILWFLIGFLFYATAYAAVASLVSRQEEIQSAVAPIGILQIAGYLLVYASLPNPSGPLATVCSLLPPFAPILMAVRMAASDVPFWQVGLAVALDIASIVGLTWLAGRMYTNAAMRIGARVWTRSAGRLAARSNTYRPPRATEIGGIRAATSRLPGRNSAGMMARAAVRPIDHQNALSNAVARPARPPAAFAASCVWRIRAKTAAPKAPPSCDRDPSGDAGVRHLVGPQAQVGRSHDRDGHRAEAGATEDQRSAEQKLIGVHAGLRVGERAGHREKKANKHDGSGADPVGQPARIASGQQHAQALRGEQKTGGEGALAAHLLLVKGQQQHRSVYRQTREE
jgi:ABC-2 type transport system permease protein